MSLVTNKYAHFKYSISQEMEAGLVLTGKQVKAIRAGECNLRDSIIRLKDGAFWLMNFEFSDSQIKGNIKLLFNEREIIKLTQIVTQKTAYLVPLNIHLKGNFLKLQVGVGKHKKQYDKRDSIKKADTAREIERELKDFRKY